MAQKNAKSALKVSLAEFMIVSFAVVFGVTPTEAVQEKLERIRRKASRSELS